jgi:hypothetical protein
MGHVIDTRAAREAVTQLAGLVEELLDAHCDTVELMGKPPGEVEWAAHLAYLRDLQRVGNEALARVSPR